MTLNRLGLTDRTFDLGGHIDAGRIVAVMMDQPELFSDLPAIPADAAQLAPPPDGDRTDGHRVPPARAGAFPFARIAVRF